MGLRRQPFVWYIGGVRVLVPLFELFSNPTISLDRIKMRDLHLVRYDPFSEVTAVVRGEDGTLLLQFTHARSRLLPEPR